MWLTRSSAVRDLPDCCYEPSSPALSVLVRGWIPTNALFLSQASQAIVQSRRVQNRQITRRRQISTGMSASRQRSVADETLFSPLVLLVIRSENPPVRGSLQLCEFHLLCECGVEHPRRKKSGQSPVLETLRNDRVACLRFRRAECYVDGFAQTLRG